VAATLAVLQNHVLVMLTAIVAASVIVNLAAVAQ
jgi:hypothetical protein